MRFENGYRKGAELKTFWLSPDGSISSGRGFLDRAEVFQSVPSFASFLNFVVGNASKSFGRGRIYFVDGQPVGMACWTNNETGEVGLIPAETIRAFLADAAEGRYDGFGVEGFETTSLLDPTLRRSLKMPAEVKDGIYVAKVRGMGTGSDLLRVGDAILAIDGHTLDAHGKYEDPRYEQLEYQHLLSSRKAGDEVKFTVWREGKQVELAGKAQRIDAAAMLVPWYEYGNQPEYIVIGGYVIQKLTRDYLEMWGEGWEGKTPPHLYHYLHNKAFEPTDKRQQIVVLSYVLPADINLGYHMLGRLVIRKVNGVEVRNLSEVLSVLTGNTNSPFHTLEFEQENPTIVIPREGLPAADQRIAEQYGIPKLVNVREAKARFWNEVTEGLRGEIRLAPAKKQSTGTTRRATAVMGVVARWRSVERFIYSDCHSHWHCRNPVDLRAMKRFRSGHFRRTPAGDYRQIELSNCRWTYHFLTPR